MKKYTAILCACFIMLYSAKSFGQTEKGKFLIALGSNLNFNSFKSVIKSNNGKADVGKQTKFELTPQVGYFVINNLTIGLGFPINYSKEEDASDNLTQSSSMAVALFSRYYFGQTKLKPFCYGEIGVGSAKYKYEPVFGVDQKVNSNLFLYEFGGGLSIFFNQYVAIDFLTGYESNITKPKENNTENTRTIESGIFLKAGISIVF